MQIGARQLQQIMDTLMSKLHTLLQPLVEGGQPPLTPDVTEIQAATKLMNWMTNLINALVRSSEAHAQELGDLTIEEMTMRRNQWPNVNAWDAFISGVKGLLIPELEDRVVSNGVVAEQKGVFSKGPLEEQKVARSKWPLEEQKGVPSKYPHEEQKEVFSKHPLDEYREALDNLCVAQSSLLNVAKEMRKTAPGAGDKARAGRVKFLPSDSQRSVHKEYVLIYYNRYMRGRDLQHQEEMVHYAAIYQCIAQQTGIEHQEFYGPDFDDFMYSYCGIKYNRSKTKRGRYRQVGDVRYACVPALWKEDDAPTIDPRLRQLFYEQMREFGRIIGPTSKDRMAHARPPKSPFL